jgi:predicted anti-sigma-YlaC factor YlaD
MGPDTRECEEDRELMSDYVDGELEGHGCARVDEHVGRCPRCQQVLSNLRTTLERVGLLRESEEPADDDAAADRVASNWRDRV